MNGLSSASVLDSKILKSDPIGEEVNFDQNLIDLVEKTKQQLVGKGFKHTVAVVSFNLMINLDEAGFVFHNLHRVREVYQLIKTIGNAKGFKETELENILIASLLKDIGYIRVIPNTKDAIKIYMNSHHYGIEIARKILNLLGLERVKVDKIIGYINYCNLRLNTDRDIFSNLLKYADRYYFLSQNYWEYVEKLKDEMQKIGVYRTTSSAWIDENMSILSEYERYLNSIKISFYQKDVEALEKDRRSIYNNRETGNQMKGLVWDDEPSKKDL